MIKKVIHYCWFGGKPLPKEAVKCIESWKKFCPDYEIIQWNEKNYDINKNKYMSDAYKEKKWAFVSDYARIDIVYTNGGIYFDTDVELIASIDKFLDDKLFCGWENRDPLLDQMGEQYENSVAFGLGFGAEENHPVLKKILGIYENLSFYQDDGSLNLIACPKYQTMALQEFGLSTEERSYQNLGIATVYPEDYFSPKSIMTGKIVLTKNTVSIHHFTMSWVDPIDRMRQLFVKKFTNYIGYRASKFAEKIVFSPYIVFRKLKKITVDKRMKK